MLQPTGEIQELITCKNDGASSPLYKRVPKRGPLHRHVVGIPLVISIEDEMFSSPALIDYV